MWDMVKDLEIDSFDIGTSAIPIQDSEGKIYIANSDYVINAEMGCKIKCYNIDTKDLHERNSISKFKF